MLPAEIIREIWDKLHIDDKFLCREVCRTFTAWFNETVDFEEEIKLIGEHIIKFKKNTVYINGQALKSSKKAETIFDNMDLAFGYHSHSLLCFNYKNIGNLIYRDGKISELGYPHVGEYYYFAGSILEYENPEFMFPVPGTVKIQDTVAIIYHDLKMYIISLPSNNLLMAFEVPCEPDDFSIVCMDNVPSRTNTTKYKGVIAMNILLGNTVISKIIYA